MERDKYLNQAFNAFNDGKITAEEYDAVVMNTDVFSEEEVTRASIMTMEGLRKIIEREVSFEKLEKDNGIYEFYQDGDLSVGISFESEGPDGEKMDRYIYNLFHESEYVNIAGYGTKENLIPEDVLRDIAGKWNSLAAPERTKEFSQEEEKKLMDLVSKGLDAGLIDLSVRENEMTAQIGEYWFYFDGTYVEDNFKFDGIPKEELVSEITGAMIEIKNDLSEDEFFYYEAILKEGLAMKENIKEWYQKEYPDDDLGAEIREVVTFESFFKGMNEGKDVYKMLGEPIDSLMRERIFTELSKRMGVDYDVIYRLWLDGPKRSIEAGNGKKPKIEVLIHGAKNRASKGSVKEEGKKTELLGDSLKFR